MICKAAIGTSAASLMIDVNIFVEAQEQWLGVLVGGSGAGEGTGSPFQHLGVILGTVDDTSAVGEQYLGIMNGFLNNTVNGNSQQLGIMNGFLDATIAGNSQQIGVITGPNIPLSASITHQTLGVIIAP